MTSILHLCDLLPVAEVQAPNPACVAVQPMDVGGVQAMAIFEHPPSRVRIPVPTGRGGGRLRFGYGIKTIAWDQLRGGVRFRVGLEVGGSVSWVHDDTVRPGRRARDRAWIDHEVALPEDVEAIVLVTEATRRRPGAAWAGWADPTIEWDAVPRRSRSKVAPGVLVFTAASCRAEYFPPFGVPGVPTPHVERLAADGLTFRDARAVTTSTAAGFATLFTGRYPTSHGAINQRAPFPSSLPNLVHDFAAAGFTTAQFASTSDVRQRHWGYDEVFDLTVSCVGQPYQDGTMTTRRVIEHLEATAGRPQTVWVDYYETHPPFFIPPERLAPFYTGDPTDPARTHDLARIRSMHGSESVLALQAGAQQLGDGRVSRALIVFLEDAANDLVGQTALTSDFAFHIRSNEALRSGMTGEELGGWLLARIDGLRRGEIDPALVDWLWMSVHVLRDVDVETIGPVRDVVDARFLDAQAAAAVAHLDAQLGALVDFLRSEGSYDDWTIVFTAPHGGVLGEDGEPYGHYTLLESVLHVPLVVKPGVAALDALGGLSTPRVVAGAFPAVDLRPTLLDLLGLPIAGCDGRSQMASIRAGVALEPRDSFALDEDAVRTVVVRGDHKLVKARTWSEYRGEPLGPGETRLSRIADGSETPVDDPDRAAELEAVLDDWLGEAGLPVLDELHL